MKDFIKKLIYFLAKSKKSITFAAAKMSRISA